MAEVTDDQYTISSGNILPKSTDIFLICPQKKNNKTYVVETQ